MSIPGFDAAQARYDSMLPDEPDVWTCPISDQSTEDCDECDGECPEPDDEDDEPADFDDYKNGMGRYADDYWLD